MNVVKITKESIDLQKRSYNNIFEMAALVSDCFEGTTNFWLHRMQVNKNLQLHVNQSFADLKQKQCECKTLINDGFNMIKECLVESDHYRSDNK
jgi:hypothetical protein